MTEKKPEDVQELLYHLTVLYERWAADKQEWAKQTIKVEQLLKEFTVRISEFEHVKEEVKKDITKSIYSAASQVTNEIGSRVKQEMKVEVVDNIKRMEQNIKQLVNAADEKIHYIEKESGTITFLSYFVTFGIALLVCILTTTFWLPTPKAEFSDKQLQLYEQGKFMADLWPKLSKAEQDRLQAIQRGQPVPKLEVAGKGKRKSSQSDDESGGYSNTNDGEQAQDGNNDSTTSTGNETQ